MKLYKLLGVVAVSTIVLGPLASWATWHYLESLDDPAWTFVAECGDGSFKPAVTTSLEKDRAIKAAVDKEVEWARKRIAMGRRLDEHKKRTEGVETVAGEARGIASVMMHYVSTGSTYTDHGFKRRCEDRKACLKWLKRTEDDGGVCVFTLQKLPPEKKREPRFD